MRLEMKCDLIGVLFSTVHCILKIQCQISYRMYLLFRGKEYNSKVKTPHAYAILFIISCRKIYSALTFTSVSVSVSVRVLLTKCDKDLPCLAQLNIIQISRTGAYTCNTEHAHPIFQPLRVRRSVRADNRLARRRPQILDQTAWRRRD